LATGLVNFILMLSPERIVMGGGVMEQKQLFPLIRAQVREKLNGYLHVSQILNNVENYIVPPGLGTKAGILGAFVLAQQAMGELGSGDFDCAQPPGVGSGE
ncbi:MAG: ROK family protein, partial [Cyanobacteria bacterium J06598_3]